MDPRRAIHPDLDVPLPATREPRTAGFTSIKLEFIKLESVRPCEADPFGIMAVRWREPFNRRIGGQAPHYPLDSWKTVLEPQLVQADYKSSTNNGVENCSVSRCADRRHL